MRPIDADALKKKKVRSTERCEWVVPVAEIDWMPTVTLKQPERKGKWIFKNDLKQFFCSECGVPSLTYDDVYLYSMNLPNFCEDCGARMEVNHDNLQY